MVSKIIYKQLENGINVLGKENTEQKKTDLKKSFEKNHRLLERYYDLFYHTDIDGKIEFISQSIEKKTGYKPEEIIGLNMKDLYISPKIIEKVLGAALLRHP